MTATNRKNHFTFLSCCTGRNCDSAKKCGRVRRRGNLVYNGPLVDYMTAQGCNKFVQRSPKHGMDYKHRIKQPQENQ